MLKIKDEVDLKELEKFGFEKIVSDIGLEYYVYEELLITKDKEFSIFKIRKLALEKFYDLIQAGLVEKVGE